MKFGACRSQLYDAQQTVRSHWQSTCEIWDDAARRDFEEHIYLPLDEQVTALIRALDQLSILFAQVRSECEFPP